MKVKAIVTLKNGVLDPQGKVIANSLSNLGFEGIQSVRQGKYIEIMLDGDDKNSATTKLNEMCEKLLANLVIEDYSVEID